MTGCGFIKVIIPFDTLWFPVLGRRMLVVIKWQGVGLCENVGDFTFWDTVISCTGQADILVIKWQGVDLWENVGDFTFWYTVISSTGQVDVWGEWLKTSDLV